MIIAVRTGGDIITNVWFLCLICLAVAVLAQAQDNPGFISIDCGALNGYRDENLTIQYSSDAGFVDSGQNMQISSKYIDQVAYQQLMNLRVFPNGTRNCYTIRPDQGKNNKYLIRASFYYGNFDGKSQAGSFDLYIDTNFWATVSPSSYTYDEIIYTPSRDYIQVCLVNRGMGDPYISALELRLLDNSTYTTASGALQITFRNNLGSPNSYRYPHDVYDRIWEGKVPSSDSLIQTTNTTAVNFKSKNNYKVPTEVLSTAFQASNSSYVISWTLSPLNVTSKWYIFFHFAEIQVLPSGQVRDLAVVVQDNTVAAITPEFLQTVTVPTVSPFTGSTIRHYIASKNTFAPFINAREVYIVIDLPNPLTDLDDVDAINAAKNAYGITKGSWQGDPCSPIEFIWSGLNCSQDSSPRITSLNLSSSGLTGNITTSFVNLTALVSLDLSFNQLTGQIPESLAQMSKLKMLNLSGNSLSGPIPTVLKKKMSDGSLKITLDGNPLCQTESCTPSLGEGTEESKTSSVVPIVIGVVVSVVVLVLLIIAFVFYKKGSNGTHGGEVMSINEKQEAALINGGWPTWNTETSQSEYETSKTSHSVGSKEGSHVIGNATRAYTPSEVLNITENFKVTIGGGGFGKVYSGTLTDGTRVAVKALSPRSTQGYKEFQAEAQLLMIVHHKNLVSLLGYCEEPGSMALIYELMPQGNLQEHLSEKSGSVLGWIQRLQIAVDAAQGLEYLHDGCRPPIIHRDLKTPNILLDEKMQAKIADFGLSRIFIPDDHESYVSTRPAGTPGYLDPMFQTTGNLNRKSDIYSFGIILFELITGHPAVIRNSKGSTHIVQWVSPLIQRGDLQSIVDPRFNGQFDGNSVWKVIETAMLCVQPVASERPETNQVLTDLKESLTVETNYSRDAEKGYTKSSSFEMTSVNLNLVGPAAR